MDVMILKKSRVTILGGLHTVALFPVNCNYAFKHIGRQTMATLEKHIHWLLNSMEVGSSIV
jgi:hypothetical protein